jgi:hypothetical protein
MHINFQAPTWILSRMFDLPRITEKLHPRSTINTASAGGNCSEEQVGALKFVEVIQSLNHGLGIKRFGPKALLADMLVSSLYMHVDKFLCSRRDG